MHIRGGTRDASSTATENEYACMHDASAVLLFWCVPALCYYATVMTYLSLPLSLLHIMSLLYSSMSLLYYTYYPILLRTGRILGSPTDR